MNKTVFFKDGMIMQVQQGNRYLKKQIAVTRSFVKVPYRFSRPYSNEEINAYFRGRVNHEN